MNILLMGNPNVGKSVIFSRLTGVRVISSNYPGTTVSFTSGFMKINDTAAEVIDVPGTYTLDPTSEAEEIAAKMLETGDVVVNVVNATNLERNLYLTLQLMEKQVPLVIALNMWDDTKHRGIEIDVEKLERILGVPVIKTSGLSGQGIKKLVRAIPGAPIPEPVVRDRNERWSYVGNIVEQVQQITHRHHKWFERLEDASVKPVSGSVIALAVLASSFYIIRFIGESLITYVFDPVFDRVWRPVLENLSGLMNRGGFFHDIIVGKILNDAISFTESFGILSSGLYVPVAMVLPYIIAFYFILGILEDTGYLPRLAILLDTTMHRLGLHGFAIIPTLLGLGCNVPAVLATRVLESERERFIAATLVAIAIPCASAQAMIFGLVGQFGVQYVVIVYLTLFIVWIFIGTILNKILRGLSPELLIEVPPYRIPPWKTIVQKLVMRIKGFLIEAIPIIMIAVLIINILFFVGLFDYLARATEPVITGILGLPKESVTAIVIGFLRKDAALGMLALSTMTAKQMVIGSVVLTMFFPCIATFVVLLRELGLKNFLKSMGIMVFVSIATGGVLNLIL
ncbi:MAG: ferrous iron transporter B [Syntrophales bacterium]|jgi:ferrous iron transport protein B|nr:ferrous iron transporter B [Syntrophales bacterium]MDY0043849.1 ferrous iron transporter B [Syntrophales bacterium]